MPPLKTLLSYVALVSALAPLLMACATSEQTGSHGITTPHSADCASPPSIEAYCASTECSTYDEHAAFVRKELIAAKGGLYRYTLGTCGALRFIREQTMGMGTDYYDASGKLVAAGAQSDSVCVEHPSWVGVVPPCQEHVVEMRSTIDEPQIGE